MSISQIICLRLLDLRVQVIRNCREKENLVDIEGYVANVART